MNFDIENSSSIEEDEDLLKIKKFLNNISDEIFCPLKEPLPNLDQFINNHGKY